MLIHTTQVIVKNLSAKDIFDFLINPSDDRYHAWWPGVHLQYHNKRTVPGNVGNLVYMDEYIGKWRARFIGEVIRADKNQRITWQMIKGIKLPAWLDLQLKDTTKGVQIDHIITMGFPGVMGKISDPLLGLYFNDRKKQYMTEHAHEEFNRLARLLHPQSHRSRS